MCRIAGIADLTLTPDTLTTKVRAMCTILRHGGPDDEGIYIDDAHVCLGHRRLSIIDTGSGGHQPMSYGSGRYVISYNGELYNYKEIRTELASKGFPCASESDTEVILAAYAAWGTAAFERFNGMFAFAIYDQHTKQLVLARDKSGIKPLYYATTATGLMFASEIRAFSEADPKFEADPTWPVYFLAYGHLPEPVTTLKGVKPLEKGSYLLFDCRNGEHKKKCFYNYAFLEKTDDHDAVVNLIQQEMSAAVQRHLIADTPIGVFLSGGLDSSIIALLANKYKANLNTVSIYFKDNEFSEKKYQDLLQQHLICSHQQFLLQEANFHESLPAIIQAMDLPCYDGINTWFISKFARQSGLKAVLSGIGGDELFGGYPSFARINLALPLQNSPDLLLKMASKSHIKKLRRVCYLTIPGAIGRYLFLRGQFIPSEIAGYLGANEVEVWDLLSEQPVLPVIDHLTPQNQASWMEMNLYMQNQLLRDADVMSMAHGIEIRVPFLDAGLVSMALKIKSEIKFANTKRKQLLIDSFKDILPEPIWNRPKMGFAFPFRDWFSDDRYSSQIQGKQFGEPHKSLKNGSLHWSQFYSLLLLQQKLK